jgi:hypothetical protein
VVILHHKSKSFNYGADNDDERRVIRYVISLPSRKDASSRSLSVSSGQNVSSMIDTTCFNIYRRFLIPGFPKFAARILFLELGNDSCDIKAHNLAAVVGTEDESPSSFVIKRIIKRKNKDTQVLSKALCKTISIKVEL